MGCSSSSAQGGRGIYNPPRPTDAVQAVPQRQRTPCGSWQGIDRGCPNAAPDRRCHQSYVKDLDKFLVVVGGAPHELEKEVANRRRFRFPSRHARVHAVRIEATPIAGERSNAR
mmetsp:Transcript_128334/g.304643  ORF Transcript_128334/g.304643 Transcript_128334/m.304643 type:complete len:114 (+) Transcript_128334:47-388(+)